MDELSSLGERLIIDKLLSPRYSEQDGFGDDCCIFRLNETNCIVLTIDPCPQPMSWILGYDDYYYLGWLLATINLSDIASMGMKPLGLLTSYILPDDTSIQSFSRMLDGVDDACRQANTQVFGGNIKEAGFISCEAVAAGYGEYSNLIRRRGARDGDFIVVIGDIGLFWAGVLKAKNKINVSGVDEEKLMKNILTPRAKIREGQIISGNKLLSSGLDNSDGLYPSVKELALKNKVDIILDFSEIKWDPAVLHISKAVGIEPIRLAVGWGDWQLVGTVAPAKYSELIVKMGEIDTPVHRIGRVVEGSGTVKLSYKGKIGPMTPIESERFSQKSWFTQGIDTYIAELLNTNLIVE